MEYIWRQIVPWAESLFSANNDLLQRDLVSRWCLPLPQSNKQQLTIEKNIVGVSVELSRIHKYCSWHKSIAVVQIWFWFCKVGVVLPSGYGGRRPVTRSQINCSPTQFVNDFVSQMIRVLAQAFKINSQLDKAILSRIFFSDCRTWLDRV